MPDRVIWGGRYAIFDELASGGMATVFLAGRIGEDPEVPAVVALKKLSAQFAKQPEFVAMFLDEAHLAARIRHPNVVATYEFLRTDEGLGIVMDLVIGMSLMELVRGKNTSMQTPPPLPIALGIVVGALDGLQAAHAAMDDRGKSLNLVHRDISPHNILVGADGVARVIDFGIAKAAGRLQVTDVGVLKGKFAYMSPEQIRGGAVDRRTDVYAAGVVLWEALAGRKLFRASSNEELLNLRSGASDNVPPPSTINRGVSPELDAIVARALSRDPSERYGSALMMAESIRAELEVADATSVAEWVRSRAGDKLDRLATRRDSIEAAMSGEGGGPPSRESIPGLPPVRDRSSRHSLPGVPPVSVRSAHLPTASERASTVPRRASPAPGVVSTLRSTQDRFTPDISLAEAGEHASDDLELDLAPEMEDLRPSLHEVRPMAERPRRLASPARRSLRGTSLLVFVVLLLGASGALFLGGPAILKARLVATASAAGVTLTVDQVSLASGGLHLKGVTATAKECPGVRLTAPEASVRLDGTGTVESVNVPGFDLAVNGAVSELSAQLTAWRKGLHAGPSVFGGGGHVHWKGGFASLEAQGTTLSVSGADGSFTLDTPNVRVDVPRGHVGPWRVRLESAANETRMRASLDPAVADAPPTATLTERKLEGTTLAIDIPRASSLKLGIPSEIFGLKTDLAIEVGLHARMTAAGDALTAEGQLGLYGWPVATGRGTTIPVDLLVSGTATGDPSKPIPIRGGKLTLARSGGPIGGTVQVRDGVRIELDRASAKGAGPALVIDTNDWTNGPPAMP